MGTEAAIYMALFALAISAVKMAIGWYFGWRAYKAGEKASQMPNSDLKK